MSSNQMFSVILLLSHISKSKHSQIQLPKFSVTKQNLSNSIDKVKAFYSNSIKTKLTLSKFLE